MADNKPTVQQMGQWLIDNKGQEGTPGFQAVYNAFLTESKAPANIMAGGPTEPKDSSLGTALEAGDLGASIASKQYLNDVFDGEGAIESTLGKAQDAFNTNIYNPLAKLVGMDERKGTALDRAKALQAENQTKIDADRQKLAGLNYAPKIASVGDIGGVGDAFQYGLERAASSVGPMAASIASGGTLALPMQAGSVNENLRNVEGLTPEARLALATGAGGLMAVAENLGIGAVLKGVPSSVLNKMGGEALAKFLTSKGVVPAVVRTMVAAAGEGGTELAQEGISMGAEALGGRDLTMDEIASRALEATAGGAAAGATFRGAGEAAGMTTRLAQATAALPGQLKATKDYANDPRQVESDLRVNDMYEATKADLAAAKNGTNPAPAPIFAGVKDKLKRQLQSSLTTLYKSGQIEADAFASLVKDHDSLYNYASKHNRDVAQSAYDRIGQLDLDPAVAEGLTRAFRDLNTVTEASFAKNSNGPLERAAKLVTPIAGAALGHLVMPGVGAPLGVIAGQVGQGLIRKGARALDAAMGSQTPEVIRRAPSRKALLDKAGVNYGSTPQFLGDLEANAQAGAQLVSDTKAKKLRDAAAVGKQNRLKDIVPLGGYHNLIYKQTGLRPTAVDQGLLMLTKDGTIDADELKAALASPQLLMSGNKGNHIIDALQQLKVDGKIAGDPKWQDPLNNPTAPTEIVDYSGSRNPAAHAATMRTIRSATDNALSSAPTPALAAVVTAVSDARTKADKRLALAQAVQANPQHQKWLTEVVGPLTQFGPKEENVAAPEAAPAPAASVGVRPTSIGTIPGAPLRTPALAPDMGAGNAARVQPRDPGALTVSKPARKNAEGYRKSAGILTPAFPGKQKMDESYLKKVADWMDKAKHEPENPEVEKAYKALAKETEAQFKSIGGDTLTVTPFEGEGEPYRNSAEMTHDVAKNKHLFYFRTESGFGEASTDAQNNPLLAKTKYKDAKGRPLLVNDLFRIVHDYYGHTQNALQFGPEGEYNAFQEHARMFSKEAVPALAAETLAQNAWVNFGPHLRDADGNIPKKGEPGFKGQKERPFSDQKNTLVPWDLLAQDANPESIAGVLGLEMQKPRSKNSDRISTRKPKTQRALEDATVSDLKIGVQAMKQSPQAFAHNTNLVQTYPGFKSDAKNPAGVAKDFVNHVKSNLLWLFDQVPAETRERSKLWYDGANRIAGELTAEYALPTRAVAGVMAALSPQKDWYQNVSLAERMLSIFHDKSDIMPDEAMKSNIPESLQQYGVMIGTVLSKPLKQQPDTAHKALWVRLYDETHNPKTYNIITPEGDKGPEAKGDIAWGSLSEIGKAINVMENTDRASISDLMGEKHKVRSFYNNIIDPRSDKGDVTIDTHAVAAGLLRPLAGSHSEVHHNFGSTPMVAKRPKDWMPAKNVGDAGASGVYGLYADAYREAAAERGVLAREMQSITWEAIRGLFTAYFKKHDKAGLRDVDKLWRQYENGDLSLDEAREAIRKRAGGIDEPTWKSGRDTESDEDL